MTDLLSAVSSIDRLFHPSIIPNQYHFKVHIFLVDQVIVFSEKEGLWGYEMSKPTADNYSCKQFGQALDLHHSQTANKLTKLDTAQFDTHKCWALIGPWTNGLLGLGLHSFLGNIEDNFHVPQCQAFNTCEIKPSPNCHLTFPWPIHIPYSPLSEDFIHHLK